MVLTSATLRFFNGRDQATLIRQYEGSDSSTTYQDTTMSYDGHGRLYQSHKPEQRDGSNNLKYTTYSYNADDSISSVTDGRGAVTNYTYNSRGLVTNLGWTVPYGSGITDPTDVTYTYDNLGNRTQMTDGLGQVDYSYNELSQMVDETRDFTDTLTDAPIAGSKFKLEYTYTLSGGLKSYKDPYGEVIDYAHDKTGRLSTVTGTTFGGVTDYASNPEYRAWGVLKHIDYGNGLKLNATFNNKLQTATYELEHPTDTSKKIFDKEYEYYNDGSLKFIKENLDPTIKRKDRLYVYDFAQKLVQAKSGTEASGTTQTNLFFLPYRQTYAYDAFGHNTERESTLWTEEDWSFYDTYTNNRRPGWTYDDNGNALNAGGIDYEYNAANALIKNSKTAHFEMTIAKGGDGHEGKRASRKWNSGTSSWEAWETNYFIASSVLGGTVSEAGDTGKKKRTFVFANGSTLARQVVDDEDAEVVSWDYSDASGQSIRMIGSDGTGTGADVGGGEDDPRGNNVGTHGSLSDPRNSEGELSPANHSPISSEIMCEREGIIGVCSVVEMMATDQILGASRGSDYPFAYSPHNSRTGRDHTNPFSEQFRANSLEAWMQTGYWADVERPDSGTTDYENNIVNINANPSVLAWVPPSGETPRWTVVELTKGAKSVLEDALKNNPKGDCAKLFGKDAIADFDKVSQDIGYRTNIGIGRSEGNGGRELTLGESPEVSAVTFGKEISLNPNGFAFQKRISGPGIPESFTRKMNRLYTESGANDQWGYALGIMIHEFLHTTGKFGIDVTPGIDGKVDSEKSQRYQKEVLKKCKNEITNVAQPGE